MTPQQAMVVLKKLILDNEEKKEQP